MDRTPLASAVLGHPVVVRLLPHLDGSVSVVGGLVRDALLGRTHLHDVDLVVEGDAIALARTVGRALGVAVAVHERFGTAVLELPHGDGHVDLISARRETYPQPGALPVVHPATLADDLGRRDFTINAMAVRVTGPRAGELVDPFDGSADLAAGVVRSLREDAFVEDPSRIVRAARYAGRLGFAVEPATWRAARSAIGGLDWASSRPADELRRLLAEADPGPGLGLLAAAGAVGIAPDAGDAIRSIDAAADGIAALDPHGPSLARWALRAGVALDGAVLDVLAVPGWARGIAGEVADGARLRDDLARCARPSEIDRLLGAAPVPAQIGALALGAPHILDWWGDWRGTEVAVRGADLIGAGIAPGPAIGRALSALRAAVIDGEVAGADAQLAYALRIAGTAHP